MLFFPLHQIRFVNRAQKSLPLDETFQQAVQHVAAVAHQADIVSSAVHALPVQNGPLKHVAEFLTCA